MRIQGLDQIPNEAIDLSQFLALDDPSQTFKITLGQLKQFLGITDDETQYISLARPSGAVPGYWYPVLIPAAPQGANITIDTASGGSALPMNNNQFAGFVAGGGWSDGGDQIFGSFHQYEMAERAIYSVHSCSESNGGIVFYVHEAAFPVTVKYNSNELTADPATGLSIPHGTSIFDGTATPGVPAGTNTKVALDIGLGGGIYSNVSGRLLGGKGDQTINNGMLIARNSADMMRVEAGCTSNVPRVDFYNGPGTLVGRLNWDDAQGLVILGHMSGANYLSLSPTVTYSNKEIRCEVQGTDPWALTRKEYVDNKAAKVVGNSAGAPSIVINAVGKVMASVTLVNWGKTYPISVQLTGDGDWWLPFRGGENADRDYDVGIRVQGAGTASCTLSVIYGGYHGGGSGIWQVIAW